MQTKKVLSNNLNKESLGYYISSPIKSMLDKAKIKVIKQDWDRVYLIDGGEGTGKSVLGLQLGYYLDPTLTLDRITFNGEDFSKAVNKADKNQCIIFDEAFNGLASSGATSKMNRFLVRKLMECRQKNLFIIIILPTFFLLQKYVAIFRSKALFHVYATRKGIRGYYRVYNEANKKILFLNGHKMYSYSTPYIKQSFIFRGKYPINEQAYRKKKHESLIKEEEGFKIDKFSKGIGALAEYLHKKYKVSYVDILNILRKKGCPIYPSSLSRIIANNPQPP